MSYLGALRLHFAGQFQAAVSTVNNNPGNFDNAAFRPDLQARSPRSWNPRGGANWRLIGCSVTSAWHGDGRPAAADDPVAGCVVADSDRAAPAKLVDLDPQQQLVSEVWGLEVRICDRDGTTLVRGSYEPAAFTDIWSRAASGGGDIGAGAMYQSVLTRLEWGDVAGSPLLAELRAAAADGLLSIKFNVDSYNMDFRSPEFTLGRIVGTIGPAAAGEPHHFVAGRQLMARPAAGGPFFVPAGGINFCVAAVDERAGKVHLDVGNALPCATSGGSPADIGAVTLACLGPQQLALGDVPYRDDGWYERTAGVVTLPPERALTAEELETIASHQLALLRAGGAAPAVAEPPGGVHVRADRFVFRLDPGRTANVRLFATRFGHGHAGATIHAFPDPNGLQAAGPALPVASPADAIRFPQTVVAGDDGVAALPIEGREPGNPRGFIDGQVYGVRPVLAEALDPAADHPFNPWDFVSVLLWDAFGAGDPVTWGDLQPDFQQYANLYPVMDPILDMADYDSVCEHRDLLLLAFGLDPADPNSMPVTRDLSSAKRDAILRWLRDVGADGKPLRGEPAPVPAVPPEEAVAVPAAAAELQGGKAAAASRRLSLRSGQG
jgi:hypothetical protein